MPDAPHDTDYLDPGQRPYEALRKPQRDPSGSDPEAAEREVFEHIVQELEDDASVESISAFLGQLLSSLFRFTSEREVALVDDMIARRSDLGEQHIERARELKRRIQEKNGNFRPALRQHEDLLLGLMPPDHPRTGFVAVRRGKIMATAQDMIELQEWLSAAQRAKPGYYAILCHVDKLAGFGLEGLLYADDDELWSFVHDRSYPVSARQRALRELIERRADGVAPFFVGELSRSDLDEAWRDQLLLSTEGVIVEELELRASLLRSLLRHARALGHGGDEDALWAALRRYATLVPAEDAGTLREFLDGAGPSRRHQVVFQCIANVFSVIPPADGALLGALRARVVELARDYLSPAPPLSGEQTSLALNALIAAAALGSAELPELERRLADLHKPWLASTAAEELGALAVTWRREGGEGTRALRLVEESRDRLASIGAATGSA